MCNPVFGMVHIKEPLLLIGKSSPCGGNGFPLSLSVWYFTVCLTPYNRFRVHVNSTIYFPKFNVRFSSVQLGFNVYIQSKCHGHTLQLSTVLSV